jgi:hypothetical protein
VHHRGLISVGLFVGMLSVAASSAPEQSAFSWTHGLVIEGAGVEVKVEGSPCHPITVTLQVDGKTVTAQLAEAPGTVTLQVPTGTSGQGYTISVSCPNARDSSSGQVL